MWVDAESNSSSPPSPPALALDCIGLWIDCNWLESFPHLSLSLVVMMMRVIICVFLYLLFLYLRIYHLCVVSVFVD